MVILFGICAETQSDRRIGEKKPRFSAEEGLPMTEFSGYNLKREEFEVEYDNDAEQLLADMDFKDTDTRADREMKLQVLRIYSTKYLSNHICLLIFDYIDSI